MPTTTASAAATVTDADPLDAVSTTSPVPTAIGSLNVSTSVDVSATSTAPFAGTVATSSGAASSAVDTV